MPAACKDKTSKPPLHFSKFLVNPNFSLEPGYFFGKQMNRHFQRYIVRMEILSTFHARVEYIFVKKIRRSNQWEQPPQNLTFLLGHIDPHLIQLSSTDTTCHPKWHPDPISSSAAVHFPDTHTQTDRLTHGIGDRSVRRALTLYYIDSV